MFQKILIANRGEIAVRIIRACREMGILTVAVCSTADKEALHAQLADECICIGSERPQDSYLNMERILSAAVSVGAEAIHPGFGFLSENTTFSRLCQQCGITFIGPSVETMEKMGDKSQARETMIQAKVPVIPGTDHAMTEVSEAKKEAEKIGYPLMIKAAAGGGGKGMRVVQEAGELEAMFALAQQETQKAFGDNHMYMEKYLAKARHIEVQILGDQHGNTIHLGERDCSIQRRHQKMIEETPALFLGEEMRREMGEAAVKAAKAAGYYSAGTIEFLVDEDQKFYFMEMNTRIQVEHPVTEMVTGVDLIKEMIKIAAGEKLSFSQQEVRWQGHAIECRVTAEDAARKFMPCAGKVQNFFVPGGKGIRVDSSLYQGCEISPFYDSMLAKIIVHGENRQEAIRKMQSALGELVIEGITTNVDFLYDLVTSEDFSEGNTDKINEILEERCKD